MSFDVSGIDIEGAILAASGSKTTNAKIDAAIEGFLAVHEWMDERGVLTPLRLAHLIGQCAHESAGFQATVENLNYTTAESIKRTFGRGAAGRRRFPSLADCHAYVRQPVKLANRAYGGRMGNLRNGDGWRYRGRGYLQLTGRENYRRAGKALGIDLEVAPERATDPEIAWQIAASYLATRSRSGKTALVWADADNVKMVTRIVNGGLNGLADRIARTGRALDTLELTWPSETIKETIMFKFLDGYKSYILGVVTILIGVVELVGIDVIPAVDQINAFNYILGGFAIIVGKSAIAKIEP